MVTVSRAVKKFPTELKLIKYEVEEYAREYGLDFFDCIFEVVDWRQMNEIASYGGFPTRYPHWTFGMDYERMSKGYAYGLQKIYELVINNDPCYAYLLESNNLVDQKIVMAHVYSHCDFFKNNMWFGHTNRKMIDEMANHGSRLRRHVERHGAEKVEVFLDCCLSIDDLIDWHAPFIKRREEVPDSTFDPQDEDRTVKKLRSKEYMDSFINPPEFIEEQRRKLEEEEQKDRQFPRNPEKDLLLFLIEHAPLDNWQRDILSIIREESYYFAPQGQTKIMNEGWATYWHSTIMTQKLARDADIVDYADHHSGTLGTSPGRLNPYKLGVELLLDIEDRWNKGRFGKEYEDCEDRAARRNWNTHAGIGREKIFEVRKIYNDVTFIDTFLTPEFCEDHKLFTYKYNERTGRYEIADRDFKKIKEKLLFSLTNFGRPFIYITDGNYRNRGELYLTHRHEGIDLKRDYAIDTLKNLHKVWQRPVHLETVENNRMVLLTCDGEEHSVKQLGGVHR
ncbi:MAG: SpoVR family protein [Candidatus Latescibacteria bacterium]|nr:SpoVR family protein [Candidatus Latescibacterota bacterium]